ncbi:hypothetical protein MHYP_G00126780 [Metynnis hypsauchen]
MKATSPFALSHWTVEAGHMGMTSRYPAILSFIDPLGAEVTSVVYDLFNSCVILSPVQDPWSCCVLSALPKSQPYLEERFSRSITTNNGGPDTLRKVKMMYGPTKLRGSATCCHINHTKKILINHNISQLIKLSAAGSWVSLTGAKGCRWGVKGSRLRCISHSCKVSGKEPLEQRRNQSAGREWVRNQACSKPGEGEQGPDHKASQIDLSLHQAFPARLLHYRAPPYPFKMTTLRQPTGLHSLPHLHN